MEKNGNISAEERRARLSQDLRRLWEQNVMWTHAFIISTVDDSKDLSFVTKRFLRSAADFASLLQGYCDREQAVGFARLFTEHLVIAASFVTEMKAGNRTSVNSIKSDWNRNADELATYLSSMSPHWERSDWRIMFSECMRLIEYETSCRIKGLFETGIAVCDNMESQALKMADRMTYGLQKQMQD